jgi:hypothetical protein
LGSGRCWGRVREPGAAAGCRGGGPPAQERAGGCRGGDDGSSGGGCGRGGGGAGRGGGGPCGGGGGEGPALGAADSCCFNPWRRAEEVGVVAESAVFFSFNLVILEFYFHKYIFFSFNSGNALRLAPSLLTSSYNVSSPIILTTRCKH